MLAAFAAETIEEAKQQNKQVLGVVPPYEVFVDGREGAPLTSVKPDGVIRAEFQLVNEALAWISTQLQIHSPVLTGHYAKSHELFADGVDTENPNAAPPAEEYVFINTQPYARKIERGHISAGAGRRLSGGRHAGAAKVRQCRQDHVHLPDCNRRRDHRRQGRRSIRDAQSGDHREAALTCHPPRSRLRSRRGTTRTR